MRKGMSLLEILVVVAIFAILGIITTRSVLLTLRGSRKSESTLKVRENVSYALSVIERQLRNADSVDIETCTGARVDYKDNFGNPASFSCVNMGGEDPYIASGAAQLRLTSNEVVVTTCSFTCEAGTSANPPFVDVSIAAKDAQAIGIEGASVTSSTKVYLRTY